MRKTMFLLLIVSIAALSSCNKNNDSTTPTLTVADLPTKATQYIDTNYPDASVLYVVAMKNSAAAFIVTLNTTEELAFTTIGNYLGDGANFHGGHHGGGDSIHGDTIHGGCGGGGHHGGGHPGGGHPGNGIPVDSLPTLIKDYVTANFAGYTIKHAEFDTICTEGAVTEVVIAQAGMEPIKLYFDATSTYLMKDNRILFTDIPQVVKDYIAANYATFETCNRATKLTLADNTLQFIVYLHASQVRKNVRLKDDGTFVCEK